jgi:hypothetical protein
MENNPVPNTTTQTQTSTPSNAPQQTTPPTTSNASTNSEQPIKSSGGIKSKLPLLIMVVVLLIIILAAVGAYLSMSQKNKISMSPSPIPTETLATPTPEPTVANESSKLDKTYTSATQKWQIDYPSNFKLDKRAGTQIGPNGTGEVIILSFLGPTQGEGTEFHDGISYTIGVMKKPANQTLQDLADEQTKPNPEVGSTRTPLKPIEINGLSGLETTVTGMGEFRIIFLNYPGDDTKTYYMAIFSDGPGKSNSEYDVVTEDMLNSFKNTSN